MNFRTFLWMLLAFIMTLSMFALSCGGDDDDDDDNDDNDTGDDDTGDDDDDDDDNYWEGKAIYVVLTWHTPGDEDETDEGPFAGADMDVHLMHPDAPTDAEAPDVDGDGDPDPYFDITHDCYWFNPNPEWGVDGAANNPVLDRDDKDGAGPELVGMIDPEDGAQYRVAAHYWNDHSFGASDVTVRLYVDEEMVYEKTETLVNHDLWCVGFIEYPSGEMTMCNPDYRIVPDYQHPMFAN